MPSLAKTGNEAMAEAMRQINPDVVAAYPITPATEIVQLFASFVSDGLVDTEFVRVESEHSAMSAVLGAAASGGRAMTGTSSQGLALMYEILPIVSALRLPVVLAEVNRTLSGPINIHCDHSDTMAGRDFGWIQIFSENAQEAYDNMLQAIKIAEHPEVRLPTMVTTDGFIISHCMQKIETLDDKEVKNYIGTYKAEPNLLDIDHPVTIGALDLQDYHFEHVRSKAEAMKNAKEVIIEVGKEFGKKYGREYKLYDAYKMEDAEIILVGLGSTMGTAKTVVDKMRAQGKKAGLLKLRVFRPFPAQELAQALKQSKVFIVLDRSDGFSSQGGPLFSEIRSAMFDLDKKPLNLNYVYGLGGREITLDDIENIFAHGFKVAEKGAIDQLVNYSGLRE